MDKSEKDLARLYRSAYFTSDSSMGDALGRFKSNHGIGNVEQLEHFITKDMTPAQRDDYNQVRPFRPTDNFG